MPESAIHIAAVVVLFEPGEAVVSAIRTYAAQVERVFLVDNSAADNAALAEALGERAAYVPLGANKGVAAALNEGARRASAEGFAWLLTMDQDSEATPGMVAALAACAERQDGAAVVSPFQREVGAVQKPPHAGCRQVSRVMTSGDLVSLEGWERVGGWREELFIDNVDDDFCIRLGDAGYRVLLDGDVELRHRVGDTRPRMGGRFHTTGHAPLRRYYMTRNRLLMAAEYGARHPELRGLRLDVLKDVVKVALFEDGKREKLAMMWRGWRDYRRRRLGAYAG